MDDSDDSELAGDDGDAVGESCPACRRALLGRSDGEGEPGDLAGCFEARAGATGAASQGPSPPRRFLRDAIVVGGGVRGSALTRFGSENAVRQGRWLISSAVVGFPELRGLRRTYSAAPLGRGC